MGVRRKKTKTTKTCTETYSKSLDLSLIIKEKKLALINLYKKKIKQLAASYRQLVKDIPSSFANLTVGYILEHYHGTLNIDFFSDKGSFTCIFFKKKDNSNR